MFTAGHYEYMNNLDIFIESLTRKLTTWKAFLLLSLPRCPMGNALSHRWSRHRRRYKHSQRYDRYSSSPGNKEVKNTESSYLDSNTTHTARVDFSTSYYKLGVASSESGASLRDSPLTVSPQHCPPYGVPAYIPVSTYPPHICTIRVLSIV